MFERNRVDNTREKGAVAAAIELIDGRTLSGRFLIPLSKTLFDVLNGADTFIEFEPYDGEREFFSKAAIRSVRLIKIPQGKHLANPARDVDGFDPHLVLGVERGATTAEIRQAFRERAMTYHPDRYAQAELPAEVTAYLDAMARRINKAYEVLGPESIKADRIAQHKTAPIYETGRPL